MKGDEVRRVNLILVDTLLITSDRKIRINICHNQVSIHENSYRQ